MRKFVHSFVIALVACLLPVQILNGGGVSLAVEIKGKSLSEISDVVKQATGKDFGELQKHSLLLAERRSTYIQPRVFVISGDGSVFKRYDMPQIDNLGDLMSDSGNGYYYTKAVRPAVSNKHFGIMRNVAYFNGGMTDDKAVTPFQVFSYTGENDNATVNAKTLSDRASSSEYGIIWDSGTLTLPGYDKDVFVYLRTPSYISVSAQSARLDFVALDRDESGDVSMTASFAPVYTEKVYMSYIDMGVGLSMAVGDFDQDGYKNDIAICIYEGTALGSGPRFLVYSVSYENGTIKASLKNHEYLDIGGYSGVSPNSDNACVSTLAGDFDGDGHDEVAVVSRYYNSVGDGFVCICKYSPDNKSWSYESTEISPYLSSAIKDGACRAARADLDGDGKDEIVVFYFSLFNDETFLKRIYCEQGSIKPRTDEDTVKSNALWSDVDFSVRSIGYTRVLNDKITITAGPLTGKIGKLKLVDDLALSFADDSRVVVSIVPVELDGTTKNFKGFGSEKRIYDESVSGGNTRAGLITNDFANEVLMLGTPSHTKDDAGQSFVSILQAIPYHVDNVVQDGSEWRVLKTGTSTVPNPVTNFTFSGFEGDNTGQMSVSYYKSETDTDSSHVDFVLSSTTETINMLGDAGPYVQGYLKFRTMEANIAGNFDPRVKAAAGAMNSIMDFITDKIQNTTTNANDDVSTTTTASSHVAYDRDYVSAYGAVQHLWRYPILNDPLPRWFVMGNRTDDNVDTRIEGDSSGRYLTFAMFDDPVDHGGDSTTVSFYQPRHEEGNFFSYPSDVRLSEGYNDSGKLMSTTTQQDWSPSTKTTVKLEFTNASKTMQKFEENVTPSELTKTVSAITAAIGVDDPSTLPPYTSHTKTFEKSYSKTERIEVALQGKSTLPAQGIAGHSLFWMPYVAREGTLKVAGAVTLNDTQLLWRNNQYNPSTNSVYWKNPDPALVLPQKYKKNGTSFWPELRNNTTATLLRGLRFYMPDLGMYSTSQLLAGLKYQIQVPLYNASFLDTGSFDVSLRYVANGTWNVDSPDVSKMTLISTVSVKLGGWSNATSGNNHGWAKFDWQIPAEFNSGNFAFYVQIDPDKKLTEVHESRFRNGRIDDVGGNNEGYFPFHVTALSDAVNKVKNRGTGTSAASSPFVYNAIFGKGSSAGNVSAAYDFSDLSGTVNVTLSFSSGKKIDSSDVEGKDYLEQTESLEKLRQFIVAQEDQVSELAINCVLKHDSTEVFHNVKLNGFNWKPEALSRVGNNFDQLELTDVESSFMTKELVLVPGQDNRFAFVVRPNRINLTTGAGFSITIPELLAPAANNESDAEEEYQGNNWGPDVESDSDSGSASGVSSSSSGGCEAGFGGLMVLGLAVVVLRKH